MDDSQNPKALTIQGEKYVVLKKFDEAIKKYKEALNIDPIYLPAYLNWGKACVKKGDERVAIFLYEKVLEIDSHDVETYLKIAIELKKLGKLESVISIYDKVLRKDVTNKEAQLQKELTLKEQQGIHEEKVAQRDAEDNKKKAKQYKDAGNAFLWEKRFADAIEKYRQVYKFAPQDTENLYLLGVALREIRNYEGLIEVMTALTKIDPNHVKAYHLLGSALRHRLRYSEAEQVYQKLAQLSPNDASVYYSWAISLHRQNEPRKIEEAIKQYKEAFIRDSKSANTLINWGKAYIKLKKYDEAILKFEQAKNFAPNDKDVYFNWALAFSEQGRYEEAIEKYKKVTSLDDEDHEAVNGLGVAFYELQHYEDARECFEKVIKNESDYYQAYINRGLTLIQLNQEKKAKIDFKEGSNRCDEQKKLETSLKSQLNSIENVARKKDAEIQEKEAEIEELQKSLEKLKSQKTHIKNKEKGLKWLSQIVLNSEESKDSEQIYEESKHNMQQGYFLNNDNEENFNIQLNEYRTYLHQGLTSFLSKAYTKRGDKLEESHLLVSDTVYKAYKSVCPLDEFIGAKDLFPCLEDDIKQNQLRNFRSINSDKRSFVKVIYDEGCEKFVNGITQKLTKIKKDTLIKEYKDEVSPKNITEIKEARKHMETSKSEEYAFFDLRTLIVILSLEGMEIGEGDCKLDSIVEEISTRMMKSHSKAKELEIKKKDGCNMM